MDTFCFVFLGGGGGRSEGARKGGDVIFLGYPQNVKIGYWNFFCLGANFDF